MAWRTRPDAVEHSDSGTFHSRAAAVTSIRRAAAPTRIPWRGWKDILWRTYEQISEDRLLLIAAGVVFYAMLAIVPAITALVSMYGLFTPARTIGAQLNFLADVMPGGAYQLISDQVTRVNTRTGESVTYLLPRSTNIRRVHVDNSTTPVTFWVGSNHGASIVKLEPLD